LVLLCQHSFPNSKGSVAPLFDLLLSERHFVLCKGLHALTHDCHRQGEGFQFRISHSLFNFLRGQMRDPAISKMDESAVQILPIQRAVGLQKTLNRMLDVFSIAGVQNEPSSKLVRSNVTTAPDWSLV
jgi:hypothetical protein